MTPVRVKKQKKNEKRKVIKGSVMKNVEENKKKKKRNEEAEVDVEGEVSRPALLSSNDGWQAKQSTRHSDPTGSLVATHGDGGGEGLQVGGQLSNL